MKKKKNVQDHSKELLISFHPNATVYMYTLKFLSQTQS